MPAALRFALEITCKRNLVPGQPGRLYARETKRPGGPYKTRKQGQAAGADSAHRDQVLADAAATI